MKNRVHYLKEKYPNTLILVRTGNFFRCYEGYSYIISYLLDYKVNSTDISDMVGFPINSLNKVLDKLVVNKIDYKVLDFSAGDTTIKYEKEFLDENNYENFCYLSCMYIKLKNRITKISEKLCFNIQNLKMEKVLNEIDIIINREF